MNTKSHRRTSAPPPVFLRGMTAEERSITRHLFTEAARIGLSDCPSGIVSTVRDTAARIIQDYEADFFPVRVASKLLTRIEQMPAFALSYATDILDEMIAGGGAAR